MSKVGWVGLGKLGLTCALALSRYGNHQVIGYDISDRPSKILSGAEQPPVEEGFDDLLSAHALRIGASIAEVVQETDGVVFLAVQTPHDPRFGGEIPVHEAPQDFEYSYLRQAVKDVGEVASELGKRITLVVVSTVLPGTVSSQLYPVKGPYVDVVYNPFFIAMGTTVRDFLHPEFVLLGAESWALGPVDQVKDVYSSLPDRKYHETSIESAELLKVAYNCYISTKIIFANMLGEICHKTGADVDEVIDGLSLATDRIISPAYMRAGMGDGGGCHPRDNLAMSWLARRLNLSVDLMGFVSHARERQSQYLADLVETQHRITGLPVVILGKAYKPNVSLTQGSPSLLLASQLRTRGMDPLHWDPYVDTDGYTMYGPAMFVIGTAHRVFQTYGFPPRSVVIDPFGYLPPSAGVTFVRPGRK